MSSGSGKSDLLNVKVEAGKPLAEALKRLATSRETPGEDGDSDSQVQSRKHRISLGGKTIEYTATAGKMRIDEEHGDRKADLFYVAYTRNDVSDVSKRPIMFTFNGGPGSSSVWLHMGAFGPKRVGLSDEGHASAPPFHMDENDCSILDATDLVFIDPVATGYSRAKPKSEDSKFHGVSQDIESVGEFIRKYTTMHGRWSSPKYLAGESYGTTRAAGLAEHLQARHGMYLNGLVLISAVLHFQTLYFDPANDLPYVIYLPSYAASAWYHKRLSPDLQALSLEDLVAKANEFASGPYARALFEGTRLTDEQRAAILETTASLTGLSTTFLDQKDLRITVPDFVEELMRDDKRSIGRLDARYIGTDQWATREAYLNDPSYAAIQGPYTAMLNHYLREELGFESDVPYEIFSMRTGDWDYGEAKNKYVQVSENLRTAMAQNPHLKVFVGNGFYDLATPFAATEYTFSHLGIDQSLLANIRMAYYEAGHMMYVHRGCHEQMRSDVLSFLQWSLGAG